MRLNFLPIFKKGAIVNEGRQTPVCVMMVTLYNLIVFEVLIKRLKNINRK